MLPLVQYINYQYTNLTQYDSPLAISKLILVWICSSQFEIHSKRPQPPPSHFCTTQESNNQRYLRYHDICSARHDHLGVKRSSTFWYSARSRTEVYVAFLNTAVDYSTFNDLLIEPMINILTSKSSAQQLCDNYDILLSNTAYCFRKSGLTVNIYDITRH